MKITVAGTGYVGLVTGVMLAEIGHHVTCFDINEEKVEGLKAGKSPIYEPGIDALIVSNLDRMRLNFTSNRDCAYAYPEIVIIAVGTPEEEDGSADLSYVKMVAKDITKYGKQKELIIVTKSTVPVGTNQKIKKWIEEDLQNGTKFDLVSNPEFLREGSAIKDTFHGDRIIIGSESKLAASVIEELYSPLNIPILHTDIESAEMIKYASNAFLATKISFINEIANICEKVGANIEDVSTGIGLDNRIGPKFLQAGVGYGGSCFPKDTKALVQLAGNVKHKFDLLESVIEVNNNQPLLLLQKAREVVDSFKGKKVAVLGVAFKPNTDDIREAASLTIINELNKEQAIIVAYDPVAHLKAKDLYKQGVFFTNDIREALTDATLAFIITEWDEVKEFPIEKYVEIMETPIIFDGRNCYDLHKAKNSGISYYSVGRQAVNPLIINS
ncbi:UDP-glucose dehydrogenase family protein [Metabacillus herbersteinensis]|uniref:UDP-glucose 6-dehydrogenase n=1 Tax=Metabacillus herbersteinensis TaxID=283816 RepID=A0ABV6GEZ8_9BACI